MATVVTADWSGSLSTAKFIRGGLVSGVISACEVE